MALCRTCIRWIDAIIVIAKRDNYQNQKRIFGSSKLKKLIISRCRFRTWWMLCVACLKSHKWGLFPHRSDPHYDIISTKVNLFDTFWTRLNLTNFHRHYSCQNLFALSGVLLHKRDRPFQQVVQKIRQQPRFGLLYFTKVAFLWYF